MSNLGLLNLVESIVLTEGRVDDAKKLAKKNGVSDILLHRLVSLSNEINPNHKYLPFLITRKECHEPEKTDLVVDLLKYFDTHNKAYTIKDINQYKSLNELESATIEVQQRERRNIEIVKDATKVFEDDKCVVVIPKTYETSCYYGKGTKWCTSSDESDGHFKSYKAKGELYYVISKVKPSSDTTYKMAVSGVVNSDAKFFPPQLSFDYYNAPDKPITEEEFIQGSSNTVLNAIKKHFTKKFNTWFKKNEDLLKHDHEQWWIKNREEEEKRTEEEKIRNDRERQRKLERNVEINNRRESGEYDDNGYVQALRLFLISEGDWEGANEDDEELKRISQEMEDTNNMIEDRQNENPNDPTIDDLRTHLELLQSELDELPNGDIYDLYKEDYTHYGLEVYTYEPNGHEYCVGTDGEADKAAYDQVESFIDDVGLEGFREGFIDSYIDEEKFVDWMNVGEMVRDSPDSYINEDPEGDTEKIDKIQEQIDSLNEQLDETEDDDERDKIQDQIDDLESTIDDLRSDGEYSEDQIQAAIDRYENDIRNDPMSELKNMGMTGKDLHQFVDMDDLIEGVLSDDGRGNGLAGYDSVENEQDYDGTTYYIYRIN